MRELIRQLKGLKTGEANPKQEWLQNNRSLLLAQIKNTVSEKSDSTWFEKTSAVFTIFNPSILYRGALKPIAIVLIVALVAPTAYYGTVKASYESLPGDWLYPAKIATEKTQVAMASVVGSKNSETKLHVEFAKRRIVETKKIMKTTDSDKTGKISTAVTGLKKEMDSVNSKLEETKKDSTQMDAAMVKEVKNDTEQIKEVLQGVKKDLLVIGSTAEEKQLSKEISETKDLVQDVSVKAVEMMVTKHLEGDTSVTKEEVKQAIDITLNNVKNEAVENKQNVVDVKAVMENVKTEMKDLTSEIKKQNIPEMVSSTKEMSDKISVVLSETKDAAVKSDVATAVVDKKITEAKTLIDNGDLAKAVDKIKEANLATKEVEKISDNTLEKTQTMFPMVQVIKDNNAVTSTTGVIPADGLKINITPSAVGVTVTSTLPKIEVLLYKPTTTIETVEIKPTEIKN